MSETRNIVILGMSFGGLGTAHYLLKHVFPLLQQAKDVKYQLHLVDPSTHFWWHIAAPRELVSIKSMPHEKYFFPIMDGFKQYTSLKDSIIFHHGAASAVDTEARNVTVTLADGGSETLNYYALVIATGIKSPTPLTTFQGGNYTDSQKALEQMNTLLASAKDVVISGGGPVGVETAGEVGIHLKGKGKVTLIAGGSKLLPILKESRAKKAEKLLEKAGVKVLYGVKVTDSKETAAGKTEVILDNGETLTADVYIPAFGVKPNADFLPAALKSETGFVKTNPKTLRVDAAGPRVYAAGDVAGVDKGGVLNMFNTLPVLHNNIALDLQSGATAGAKRTEKTYVFKDPESQIVPVGPKMGVGAFNGFPMPAFMISMVKGKDYMASGIADWTEGKKFAKA